MSSVFVLLALGSGCRGACPSFDEMDVIDPDGLADDAQIAGMWRGIERFADWSGRQGVCVPEIKVVHRLKGLNGQFIGLHEPILVASKALATQEVVVHEMCHAVDSIEDYHEHHPRLFSPQLVRKRTHYRADEVRAGEAFARACDDGPQELAISTILEDECGREVVGDARRFVRQKVWSEVEEEPLSSSRPAVTVGRARIQGLSDQGSLRAYAGLGDDLLFVMAWEAARPDEARLGQDEHRVEHHLVRIDPQAAEVIDQVELPVDIDEFGSWSLLPSAGGPALLVYSGPATQAWLVEPSDLSLHEISFPRLAENHGVAGVIIDGWAWFSETAGEGAVERLRVGDTLPEALADFDLGSRLEPPDTLAADLPDEDTPDENTPDEGLFDERPDRSVFDQGQAVAWMTFDSAGAGLVAGSNDRVVRFDAATGQGVVWRLPDTWTLHTLATLPDGRLVTGNLLWSGVEEEVVTGLLVFDPASGVWSLPADPCGAARIAQRFALASVGGAVWLVERGGANDFLDEGTLYLSQVVVER